MTYVCPRGGASGIVSYAIPLMLTLFSLSIAVTVHGQKAASSTDVRLILPPVIYAASGIETNVYFQNVCLMLNPDNYAFDVNSPKGYQLQERWTYTPAPDEAGDYPFTLEVKDAANRVIARASTTIHVAPQRAGTKGIATILMIGASLTDRSVYPQHVLNLTHRDPYVLLKFIGSHGPDNRPPTGELRHEGYSGWTAEAFATRDGTLSRSGYYKGEETGSPFVYRDSAGKSVLNFKRYCDEFNAGRAPDFVTIQVGINDTWSATDETIDRRIDDMLGYYDQLVAMVHNLRQDSKIGVFLVNPPSVSQDGFRNYRGSGRQTRWQARRNQHRLVERLIAHYGRREREHIYLMPVYLALDVVNNYPTSTSPLNMNSQQSISRVSNGTHPADAGYQQIGDVIFCWLKSMLGEAT